MKYELKFIGNLRKSASLSRLFDDLLEKTLPKNCNGWNWDIKYGKFIVKVSVDIFLKFEKRYQIKVDKKLIAKCKNTFEFCNGDLNKFVLLLYKVLILMNVLRDGKKFKKIIC